MNVFAGTGPIQWQGPDCCARHSHRDFHFCCHNVVRVKRLQRRQRHEHTVPGAGPVLDQQVFDDFINDSGSVWSKAGSWQTQNQGARIDWASFFCFDECSGNSKLDLQVFGVRSWDDLVDFFRSASHVLGPIEMICLTILTLLFGLLHVSQIWETIWPWWQKTFPRSGACDENCRKTKRETLRLRMPATHKVHRILCLPLKTHPDLEGQ